MNKFLFSSPARVAVVLTTVAIFDATISAAPRTRQATARNLTYGYAAEPGETLRPTERAFLSKAGETSR